MRAVALVVSGALFGVALLVPGLLLPLNLLWRKLAWRIAVVFTYVVLGAIFYLVFTPIGLVMRVIRRDPMMQAMNDGASDYWAPVRRQASSDTLDDQF